MYNINMKNLKKNRGIFLIFLIVGILIFLGLSVAFAMLQRRINSLDSSIMSTDVYISSNYEYDHEDNTREQKFYKSYKYIVDGNEYYCKSNVSSSYRPNKKNKEVYYDSKEPANCNVDNSQYFLLIFLILPVIFITIGLVGFIKGNTRIKNIKRLMEYGQIITNLEYRLEDSNITVNGRRIQRAVVDYQMPDGKIVTLKSDPLYDNIYAQTAQLLIDFNNPDLYYLGFNIV